MARLNAAASVTPSVVASPATGSRTASLYRDPTPYERSTLRASTGVRSSAFPESSPSPSQSSDKENLGEASNRQPRQGKSLMDPPSARRGGQTNGTAHSNKKRRLGEHNIPAASQQTYASQSQVNDCVELQYYDPDQDPEARRQLRQSMRENERALHDRRDELVQPESDGLIGLVMNADAYMKDVRQTSDATLDSRFLLSASGIALTKAKNLALGDTGLGVDVDEFVSKCITFMRNGGPLDAEEAAPSTTQRRRRPRHEGDYEDDEDEFENGDGLDWDIFGERACFPNNRRPPVPSFLLGPLSVQKRVRTVQRRARIERNPRREETRPEELKAQDLQKNESSNLTSLCRNIRDKLQTYIQQTTTKVEQEAESEEDLPRLLVKHRLAMDQDKEPCVRLLEFAINPWSFGQSVENLFYISFLIRDGSAELALDENGEAILKPQVARSLQEQRDQEVSKNQSILGLDWPTWKAFIRAYDITEPLIEHRNEEEGLRLTGKGWYG